MTIPNVEWMRRTLNGLYATYPAPEVLHAARKQFNAPNASAYELADLIAAELAKIEMDKLLLPVDKRADMGERRRSQSAPKPGADAQGRRNSRQSRKTATAKKSGNGRRGNQVKPNIKQDR